MAKRDLALDLFKTFKTGVTRKANKPAPTKTVGQVGLARSAVCTPWPTVYQRAFGPR